MRGVLVAFGARDVLTVDGAAEVAARAGVEVGAVERVDDLAERALNAGASDLEAVFAGAETPVVAGCSRPRAARALLAAAGVCCAPTVIWLPLPFDRDALRREPGLPWYPVIDRSRCVGCGICSSYCLFGVYRMRADHEDASGRVRVKAPLNCKIGCPACARLCPESALIFPFCPEADLNGEIEPSAPRTADALRAAVEADPMRALAARRRGPLVDPAKFDQAERERILNSGVL